MAQVRRLSPKVGSCLVLFCIHRVNRVKVNSRNMTLSHNDNTINIVLVIIIIIFNVFIIVISNVS